MEIVKNPILNISLKIEIAFKLRYVIFEVARNMYIKI